MAIQHKKKPIKKRVIEEDEELEGGDMEENEEDDSEDETGEDEQEDTDSDAEYDEPDETEGEGLNVQWLQKIDQKLAKLEKTQINPANLTKMIQEGITETLSGMSMFKILPKTQPNQNKQKPKGAGQKVVKIIEPIKRKPLFSKRKK